MNLVHDYLRAAAGLRPDCPAVLTEDGPCTFARLDEESDRLAAELQCRGLARGDRVVLFLPASAELVTAIFGVLKAGGVFIVVNPVAKARRLAHVLRDSGARVLLADPAAAELARAAAAEAASLEPILWSAPPPGDPGPGRTLDQILAGPPAVPSDPGLIDHDLCTMIYTSGSMGAPKGVMLTHRNVVNTTGAIAAYLENTPDDVVLCVLPLSFSYGLFQVLTGVRVGYTVVLERTFGYPQRTLERMAECRVTGLPGVPTTFATLLGMDSLGTFDFSPLRYLTNAGDAIPPAHVGRLLEAFPHARFYSMYGQTECTRATYLDPARAGEKPSSVGKAIGNCEVYVVDERGRRVGPGVVGELVVRGANVMRGYWGNPGETRRRLRDGDIPGEKVLYTGDLFRMDDEGLLYFVSRKDDVFKCKGEKVSPSEIQSVLYELEGVAQAAVVGVADPIDGMAIKAFVVPRNGAVITPLQVRRHCRSRIESYLVPKVVEICRSLPQTETGKIVRAKLA